MYSLDRKILVEINGSYVRKDSKIAGVQGEGNATYMNMIFDDSWSGFAKTVTFYNSKGENPIEIVLTADLLTDIVTSLLDYTVPIPPEPLAIGGEIEMVIDGYKDGVRTRSVTDSLTVKFSSSAGTSCMA